MKKTFTVTIEVTGSEVTVENMVTTENIQECIEDNLDAYLDCVPDSVSCEVQSYNDY